MKILAVTFEPNDTARAMAVHQRLALKIPNLKPTVLVGDPWQVARKSASRDLQQLASRFESEYETLEKPLLEGLRSGKHDGFAESSEPLSSEIPIFQSSRLLYDSDNFFSNYERTYLSHLSPEGKISLFRSVFNFLDQRLTTDSPDFVWCVGSNYLAKATVASLCQAKGIQFRALVFSRVGNINVWNDNLGVGADSQFKEDLLALGEAEIQVGRELKGSLEISLRENPSHGIYRDQFFDRGLALIEPRSRMKDRFSRSVAFVKDVLRVLLVDSRDYHPFAKGIPYLRASAARTIRFYFLQQYRVAAYLLLGLPGGLTNAPEAPYFAYALHLRPESSTLTLGAGTNDEEAIAFISRRLPLGFLLAVKENPTMVEDRPRSFYRQLQRLPNVVIVDPQVPSSQLVLGSLGTLGVSGTILLESEILGVPSLSLGTPEFDVAISAHGFDSVTKWLVDRTRLVERSDTDKLDRYLGVLVKRGREMNPFAPEIGSREFEDVVRRLTSFVSDELARTDST